MASQTYCADNFDLLQEALAHLAALARQEQKRAHVGPYRVPTATCLVFLQNFHTFEEVWLASVDKHIVSANTRNKGTEATPWPLLSKALADLTTLEPAVRPDWHAIERASEDLMVTVGMIMADVAMDMTSAD